MSSSDNHVGGETANKNYSPILKNVGMLVGALIVVVLIVFATSTHKNASPDTTSQDPELEAQLEQLEQEAKELEQSIN